MLKIFGPRVQDLGAIFQGLDSKLQNDDWLVVKKSMGRISIGISMVNNG